MKIELGKLYKTRRGQTVGPIERNPDTGMTEWPFLYHHPCGSHVTIDADGYQNASTGPLPADLVEVVFADPGVAVRRMTLPTDSAERKEYPMADGLLAYFPAALAGVAKVSKAGNDKHNPGEPLHHARGKSGDHANCILRHLTDVLDLLAEVERGQPKNAAAYGEAALHEANQLAWRALALSQELHERLRGAPLAPGAR